MNAIHKYDDNVLIEMTSWGPFKEYDGANLFAEFSYLYDGAGRDITVKFSGKDIKVTVTVTSDGGASTDTGNASTTLGNYEDKSFDIQTSLFSDVTTYIKGTIKVEQLATGDAELYGLRIENKHTDLPAAGTATDGGYIPTDDDMFRDGGDPLDFFMYRRLSLNLDKLAQACASRGGKAYNTMDPLGDGTMDYTSTFVVGSIDWRLLGPFFFQAAQHEDTASVILTLADGGGSFAKHNAISVIGLGQGYQDLIDNQQSLTTTGTSYMTFTGVPLQPGGTTKIYVGISCDKEDTPESEISWSANSSPIMDMRAGNFPPDSSSKDFAGGKLTGYSVPYDYAIVIKEADSSGSNPDHMDDARQTSQFDVAMYRELLAGGAPAGFSVTPNPALRPLPDSGTEWTLLDTTTFRADPHKRNYIQLKSFHAMATPGSFGKTYSSMGRPSAYMTKRLYNACDSIVKGCVPTAGIMHHGSFGQQRDVSTQPIAQSSADAFRFGPWLRVGINEESGHGGWTDKANIPATWYVPTLPYGHVQNPASDYEEVSRSLLARIAFFPFVPHGITDAHMDLKFRLCFVSDGDFITGVTNPTHTGDTMEMSVDVGEILTRTHYSDLAPNAYVYDIARFADCQKQNIYVNASPNTIDPAWSMQAFLAMHFSPGGNGSIVLSPWLELDLKGFAAADVPGYAYVQAKEEVLNERWKPRLVVVGGILRHGARVYV